MVYSQTRRRPQAQVSQTWVILFGIWIALVIPLLALGVAAYKNTKPVSTFKATQLEWNVAQEPEHYTRLASQAVGLQSVAQNGTTTKEWDVMAIAPQNPRVILIAAGRNVLLTRDGGESWLQMPEVLPARASALAISPEAERVMYAQIPDRGLYVSTDGGWNWRAAGQ